MKIQSMVMMGGLFLLMLVHAVLPAAQADEGIERNRYYQGRELEEKDLSAEQKYAEKKSGESAEKTEMNTAVLKNKGNRLQRVEE